MPRCPACNGVFPDPEGKFCPDDGTPLVPDAPSSSAGPGATAAGYGASQVIGSTIAQRYRVIRKIGEGGMGVVYEVEHQYLKRTLALKVLHAKMAGHAEAVERLQIEAQAASAIGHPNIIHVEDFGFAEDGAPFMALEWLEGETLEDLIARGRIPLDETIRILCGICDGLAAAHRANIVHRDLKPANIFLTKPQHPGGKSGIKILDFGIAKLNDRGKSQLQLTQTGTIIGTPYYLSPEQAEGGTVDHRSDIYALGVVGYEMLSGRVPFDADSVTSILLKHCSEIPPLLSDHIAALEPFDHVVLRALEKDPKDRYQKTEAFRSALTQVQVGQHEVQAAFHAQVADKFDALENLDVVSLDSATGADIPIPPAASEPAQAAPAQPAAAQPAPAAPALSDDAFRPKEVDEAPLSLVTEPEIRSRDRAASTAYTRRGTQSSSRTSVAHAVRGQARKRRSFRLPFILLVGAILIGFAWMMREVIFPPEWRSLLPSFASKDPPPKTTKPKVAPAETVEPWSYTGKAKGFEYEVTLSPGLIKVGSFVRLELHVIAKSKEVLRHMSQGRLQAHFTYTHDKSGQKTTGKAASISKTGFLKKPESISLAQVGDYEVTMRLKPASRRMGQTKFFICVGAHPLKQPAMAERMCPKFGEANYAMPPKDKKGKGKGKGKKPKRKRKSG